MPLELTLHVDDQQQVVATCADVPLGPPTPLTELPLITADLNPYQLAPAPLGQKLFAALGGAALLGRLAATDDRTLLLITDEAAAALPWEYAHNGGTFLGCDYALLRLLPSAPPPQPAPANKPLNFLALAADPLVNEAGEPSTSPRLDVENELRKVSQVLRDSGVNLTAQRVPPLLSRLQRALRRGPAILHLSCHGSVERISENGVAQARAFLALEDANGKLTYLRGDRLVNLAPRGVLRLILLSACQSALHAATPPAAADSSATAYPTRRADANLARALVMGGVPAAIGMQGNFPDPLSDELAVTFYAALLAGHDVGEALRQARWRLHHAAPYAVGLPVAYVAPGGWGPLPISEGRSQVQAMSAARYANLPLALHPPQPLLGRDELLHQLARTFRSGQEDLALEQAGAQVVTVVGTGGIGKTALAAALAQRFGWRWPGGVIGVSLADLPTLRATSVLLALLGQLPGIDVSLLAQLPDEALARRLAELAGEADCLILVDNYESVLELLEADAAILPALDPENAHQAQTLHRQLAQLAQRGLSLLLTSRQQPAGFVGEVVFPAPNHPLAGITTAAGTALFFLHSTQAKADPAAHRALAVAIAASTEGHPLAIALLAGEYDNSYQSVTIEHFLANWAAELAAAQRPGLAAHHVSFTVAFERSFAHLAPAQQQQLLALSCFPAPFFAEGAALLWGQTLASDDEARWAQLTQVRSALGEFLHRSLLKVDNRFSDSDLPATYRLEPVIQRELRQRAGGYDVPVEQGYRAYTAWLVNRAYGETGRDVGLARLVQQWLDELIVQADAQPLPERAWYCWRLGVLARQFGRLDDDLKLLEAGELCARQTEDERALSRITTEQATVWVTRGDLDRALKLYEESLALLEKLGDLQGKAASLHAMAQVFLTRGDLDRALKLYEESLALKEKLGDLQGKAASLHAMAQVFLTRGDLDRALKLYEESLALKEKLGDLQGKAASLHAMAQVFLTRGDLDRALKLYEESLALKEKLGDIKGKAASLHAMAQVFLTRGDLDRALKLYEESLALLEKLGDLQGKAASLHAMAQVFLTRGDLDRALKLYEESLALKEKLGDLQGKAASLHAMAQVFLTRGDLDRALKLYEESLALLEKLGDLQGKAASLHAMAQVFLTRGDLDRALKLYEESLALKEKLGDLQGKAASLSGMANLFMQRQDWARVAALLQEALTLSQQLRDPAGIAFKLVKLGQVAQAQGDLSTARQRYKEGLVLFERLGMPEANQVRSLLAGLAGNGTPVQPAITLPQALLALVQAASGNQHPPATLAAAASELAATPGLPAAAEVFLTQLAAGLGGTDAGVWAALSEIAAPLATAEEFWGEPPVPFWLALARLFDRQNQPVGAVHCQAQAIDHLRRQQGNDQNAQETLSVALYNQASYLANVDHLDEAVAALQEVVVIDQRWNLADLASDQTALATMRRRRAGWPDDETPAPANAVPVETQLTAQLANLSPAERAQVAVAMRALAQLSPAEQQAYAQAAQQAQLAQQVATAAQQIIDATLAAVHLGFA